MASGSGRTAGEKPPLLPVKQHRRSSVDSDCVLSPVGLQQNYGCNDVFPEPTDCHADQCPIHQRYDFSRHQERFFSDMTPPPVPKKRLTRALSLPGFNALPSPSRSPLSPLQRCPQNFDNPLYMMAPIPDSYIHEETESFQPSRESSVSSPSFSQLSFDTPDEHLSSIFSNFMDPRLVSERVQHHHLLSLRSMAQSIEDQNLQRDVLSFQPQDFLLCKESKPRLIGDKTYYSLHSPKFPERIFGLRVLKQTSEAPSADNQSSHVNVQNVVAFFQPNIILENNSNIMHNHPEPNCSSSKPPGEGSTEEVSGSPNSTQTVQSFLQRGHCVSIERDLPLATLEDFVQESCSLQITQCQDYDRQVCVLMLQILMGSQHLHNNGAVAAKLRPQEILLVWPSWGRQKGENLLEGDAPQLQSSKQEEMDHMKERGRAQVLWKRFGSPRVVLMPQSSAFSAPQSLTDIKSQIRSLIQFCLRPPEGLSALVSDLALFRSSYRRGLLHLSSLLQSDSGPQMADIMALLQVLLWGPQVSLFSHRGISTSTTENWLTVKRALMVMKLAERGLIQDQSALDWEDCMCLKYLSFTDSETVVGVATQLWNALNYDTSL